MVSRNQCVGSAQSLHCNQEYAKFSSCDTARIALTPFEHSYFLSRLVQSGEHQAKDGLPAPDVKITVLPPTADRQPSQRGPSGMPGRAGFARLSDSPRETLPMRLTHGRIRKGMQSRVGIDGRRGRCSSDERANSAAARPVTRGYGGAAVQAGRRGCSAATARQHSSDEGFVGSGCGGVVQTGGGGGCKGRHSEDGGGVSRVGDEESARDSANAEHGDAQGAREDLQDGRLAAH